MERIYCHHKDLGYCDKCKVKVLRNTLKEIVSHSKESYQGEIALKGLNEAFRYE
jgi:hypothetical protein